MSVFRLGLAVLATTMLAVATPGVFTGRDGVANAAAIPGGSITDVCANAGTVSGSTFTLTANCGDVTDPITVPKTITTVNGNGHTISATDIGSSQFNGGILTNESPGQTMNIENLTVSGPVGGFQICTNSNNVLYGIYFNDAGGSVNKVTVKHIWQQPNASNAPSCNTGTAIRAGNPSAPRTVTVTNTKVFDYQKNGIDGRGATMTMDVSGSTMGPPNPQEGLIAANGLVYFDSTGTATHNTILGSGDQACPFPPCKPGTGGTTNATAVLLFGAKNVTITHNMITGDKTDIGVSVSAGTHPSSGGIISYNNFARTTPDDPDPTGHGIDVYTPDGSSATPICNTFSNWKTNIVGAVQISCEQPPDGTECEAYSTNVLSAEGGMAPFSWSVASGTLPPGLKMAASDGAITGTPTLAGTFHYTVRVVAADNQIEARSKRVVAADKRIHAGSRTLTATQAQTITIHPGCAPALKVAKSVTSIGPYDSVGVVIRYSITVANTGNTTLTGVKVTDPGIGAVLGTCTPAIPARLAPGDSVVCTATHTVTQADLDAGHYTNVATGDSDQTPSSSDTATVPTAPPPSGPSPPNPPNPPNPPVTPSIAAIAITKSPSEQSVPSGKTAAWTITVTNTGNVPLTNVTVADAEASGCARTAATLPVLSLITPNASVDYTCERDDVTASFTNVAVATGEPPTGQSVNASASAHVTVVAPEPAPTPGPVKRASISLEKNPTSQTVSPGGTATFRLTVTNTGDVELTSLRVNDPHSPHCNREFHALGVGESRSYDCEQPNVRRGFVNTATVVSGVSGRTTKVRDVARAPVKVERPFAPPAHPAIRIVKSPSSQSVGHDGTARFRINVTNTGNVELRHVTVTDRGAPNCNRDLGSVSAGTSETYDCERRNVTAAFVNRARVDATTPTGRRVTDNDTAVVRTKKPKPVFTG
jgi:uncharacterized repeat protein (TIGR01451 family)